MIDDSFPYSVVKTNCNSLIDYERHIYRNSDAYEIPYDLDAKLNDTASDMDNDALTSYQKYNYSSALFESDMLFEEYTYNITFPANTSMNITVISLFNGTYCNRTNPVNLNADYGTFMKHMGMSKNE